ncbi:GNAT family N-acetyltransferase [Azospirillum halopraeferens]|uniref:GNAT family N-acetyltransferase n=1 Tax=Azospirillum halopraeferens TaxID=34010 RepID=UPI00042200C1|nr:GNAT family N-acetyltransferase [Azospirillum halopraeferens]
MSGETEFGPYRDGDAGAVAYLARHAFGLTRESFERARDLFGADTLRVLRRAGRPAGSAAVWTWNQWFGGRPVPSRAVAFVSVDPAARGGGLATGLMRAVLEEAHGAGCALAVLYAATQPLYAKVGFARSGSWFRYRIAPDRLAAGRPGALPQPMETFDADVLAGLRRREAAQGNGLVERTEAAWTYALHPFGEEGRADVFLTGPAGAPDGYVAVMPPSGRRLVVVDHCVLSGSALRRVRDFLAGYRSMVDEIVWVGGPEDPLVHGAHEARAAVDGWEEWLLRVVDVEAALTARGYPPGATGDLTITVADPLFACNHGCFHLTVANGRGTVTRPADAGTGGRGVRLSVAALAPLYTGHLGPAALARQGLMEGTADDLATAARLFAGPRPWMPDRF